MPAKKRSTASPSPSSCKDYTYHDFLIGRQHFCRENGGNLLVRKLVERRFKEYERADKASDFMDKGLKKDKSVINKEIVAAVKQQGGRFLRQNKAGGWEEVSDRVASEKILELFKYLRKRNKQATDVMVPATDSSTSSPQQKQSEEPVGEEPAAPNRKKEIAERVVQASPHHHHSEMLPISPRDTPRSKQTLKPTSKPVTFTQDHNTASLGITAAEALWMSWQSVSSSESAEQTIRVEAGLLHHQDNVDMMNDDIMSISVTSSMMNEQRSIDVCSKFSGSSCSRAMSSSSKMSIFSRPSRRNSEARSKSSCSISACSSLTFIQEGRRETPFFPTEISTAKHGRGVWFALDYVLERLKDSETDEDEVTKFMAVLEKLTTDPTNHEMLMAPGHLHESSGIRVIVDTMRKFARNKDVQVAGCLALSHMIVSDESRIAIEREGGFQALLDAQQRHRDDETVVSNTFVAIQKLSRWHRQSTITTTNTGLVKNQSVVGPNAPQAVVTLPTGKHGITFWGTHHVMIAHIDDEAVVPGLKVGMLVDAIEIPGGNLYVGMTTRELYSILKETAHVQGRLMTVKLPSSDYSSATRGAVTGAVDGWSMARDPTAPRKSRSHRRFNPSTGG